VVGAHIVFDLLDLDRSDLPNQLFHGSLVAVTATADARRLPYRGSLPWHPLGRPAELPAVSHSALQVTPQHSMGLPATHGSRLGRRWQVHASRNLPRTAPPSAADPARPFLPSA
jgi:hypothetical protein